MTSYPDEGGGVHTRAPGIDTPTDQAAAIARELDRLARTGQLAELSNMAPVLRQIADLLETIGRVPERQP